MSSPQRGTPTQSSRMMHSSGDSTPQAGAHQDSKKKDLQKKMSSSLKERLKKCGRYHPGTPRLASITNTNLSDKTEAHTPKNTKAKITGLLTPQSGNSQTTNPQAPNSNTNTENDQNTSVHTSHILNNDDKLSHAYKGISLTPISVTSSLHEATPPGSVKVRDASHVDRISKSFHNKTFKDRIKSLTGADHCEISDSPSIGTSTDNEVSSSHESYQSQSTESGSSGTTCSQSLKDLVDLKSKLNSDLQEKEEQLRKLKMVKMYRDKNNLVELQKLIDTWRSVTQTALHDLLTLHPQPRPSMADLLAHLQVDPSFVGYNEEEDGFIE